MTEGAALRVLFVEDFAYDAELAALELRREGLVFEARRVETEEEFLQALAEFDPSVVISDYSLPSFDGMQALRLSRAKAPFLPFIILTGSMNEETAVECMKAGADDYVIKEHLTRLPFAVRGAMERKKAEKARQEAEITLRESEAKHRTLFETMKQGVIYQDGEGRIVSANPAAERILDLSLAQMRGLKFTELDLRLIREDGTDFPPGLHPLQEAWEKGIEVQDLVVGISSRSDGRLIWANFNAVPLFRPGEPVPYQVYSTFEDITGRKQAEEALRRSEALKSSIIEAIPDIIIRHDRKGTYLDIFAREKEKLYFPSHQLLGKTVKEVLPMEVASGIMDCLDSALLTGRLQSMEFELATAAGVLDFEARFCASGPGEVVACIRDVTERKRYEQQLKHLSLHDQLTGLYNRTYFEEAMERLSKSREYPITIISLDLDGLKLINDTVGHSKGDETLVNCARLLRQSLRSADVLARIGGDEFAAILPKTDAAAAEAICQRIRERVQEYNILNRDLPLSVSVGVATARKKGESLVRLLKQADDLMYRDKLYRGASARSKIVESLLAALAERDFVTEGHTRRVAKLCQKVGEKAGLTSRQLANLSLLSQVHDLGKVGIPDKVLFKPEPLNEEEWQVMRLHPEKGYRVALSSPELAEVADLILKHHEHWDGKGYPLGLKGRSIPVECRIMAIVDAYDAMTNDRVYNKARSREEAIAEIRRCAGSQFDPEMVDIFLAVLEQGCPGDQLAPNPDKKPVN